MNVLSNGPFPGMSLGVPNVGLVPTPAGPVPTPSVSVGTSDTVPPSQVTNYVCCTPTQNMAAVNPVTTGCVGPGVASGEMFSECAHTTCSEILTVAGTPVVRWLDTTTMNGIPPNDPGGTISPSETLWMVMG